MERVSTSPIPGAIRSPKSIPRRSQSSALCPRGSNRTPRSRISPAVSFTSPTASATMSRWSTWRRARRSSAWRQAAAPATWRFRPMAPASIAPTSTLTPANFARRPNPTSRSSTPPARWSASAIRLPNAAGVFHVALSADGRLGMAAQLRPKNLIPLAHVEHGWVFGNSISVFGADVRRSRADPARRTRPLLHAAVRHRAGAGQKRRLHFDHRVGQRHRDRYPPSCWSSSARQPRPQRRTLANDLSASANYVAARIPVGSAPKGLALSPDGKRLYVANRTDDTISVIDTASRRVTATLSLEGPATLDAGAPRRASLLQRPLRLPGPFRLRQLPPRIHLRRPAVGPGAGRLRQRHRR